jgi:hypothetical protein
VEALRELGGNVSLGEATVESRVSGPMAYTAVLKTSFPEEHTRDELLEIMRRDAETARDELGFGAELRDGEVLVSHPMSTLVWTKP